VSTVMERAGESPDSFLPGSVCRAVIERAPSGRSCAPSVVTVVVVPLAVALPMAVPSA